MKIICSFIFLFCMPKAICAPEIWTPSPVMGQVEGSCIWYYSNIQTSTSGARKHLCVFGFKKKTGTEELTIIPILKLPAVKGVVYTWNIEDQVLIIKKNDQIVVKLELKPLEELARRDKNLETYQNDDDIRPTNIHVDLDARK